LPKAGKETDCRSRGSPGFQGLGLSSKCLGKRAHMSGSTAAGAMP
jgi:hypothetical protein